MAKLSVLIPGYNERQTILTLIEQVQASLLAVTSSVSEG